VAALSVSIYEFPAEPPATITPERGTYCFFYRPRTEKGETRLTVPELGLSRHRVCRDHVLVSPPFLPVHGQWERADGWVARFSFSPRSIEAAASKSGPAPAGLEAVLARLFFDRPAARSFVLAFDGRNGKPVPAPAIVVKFQQRYQTRHAISLIPFDRLDFRTLGYPQNGAPFSPPILGVEFRGKRPARRIFSPL
jgi:hypothetical protein